jgi:glycerol-3-phosphate acyltransferase PlsY
VAGNRVGGLVLLGDLLKGTVPVYLAACVGAAMGLEGDSLELCISLAALGAFLGHLYPVYSKGRSGGKGVATVAGCFLVISPVALACALFLFILMVWRFRIVSLGSITAAAGLPVLTWLIAGSPAFTGLAVVVAVLIVVRHSGNIRRLREGKEPKI